MTFILSKIFWILFRPLNLAAIGFVIVLVLSKFGYSKLKKIITGVLVVFVFSACFTSIPDFLIYQLEIQHPREEIVFEPAGIIVLGGGFDNEISTLRGNYALSSAGGRILAGLELMKKFPTVPMIYSGGSATIGRAIEPEALSAKKLVEGLFGDKLPIIYESKARNTWENAILVSQMANKISPKGKWLLITSAFHMPRSMGCFRKVQLDVAAWPADYRSEYQGGFWLTVKSSKQIGKSELVIKEIIGLIAYRLLGRLN